MCKFQYYEFVAIDSPLSLAVQKELRAITSRATITATRLVTWQAALPYHGCVSCLGGRLA